MAGLFFVPWAPHFPSIGLDPSWKYGLNEALAHGAVFGRDVVFTFGPYASVYSRSYHPATDGMMIGGSIAYAVGFCATFLMLAWPRRVWLLVGLPVIVSFLLNRDAAFMALPFALLAVVVRCTLPRSSPWRLRPGAPVLVGIALATCAIAFSPLIKGSFAATSGFASALIFLVLVRHRVSAALGFAVLFALSLGGAWLIAGQSLDALPHFFLAQAPVVSGYTNAMSANGPAAVVVIYAVGAIALFAMFYRKAARHMGLPGYVLLLGLAFTLFVSFKAGFVRQDGHVFISGELLLFIGLMGAMLLPVRHAAAAVIVSALAWGAIGNAILPVNGPFIVDRLAQTWRGTVEGLATRINTPEALQAQYDASLAAIRSQEPMPAITGTVDIYPTEISGLLAAGLKWAGRPVFQSYSVYTPELNQLNNAHLTSDAAPDTVLFAFDPIDGRLPALDDSLSLRTLLTHYGATEMAGRWMVMKKDDSTLHDRLTPATTQATRVRTNTPIRLPTDTPVWMTVDISPTLLGRAVSTLYKLPRVWIVLQLANGETIRHRFIPGIGRSGFLASPYVDKPEQLRDLQLNAAGQRRVASVTIESNDPMLWSEQMNISLTPMNVTPPPAPRPVTIGPKTESAIADTPRPTAD